MINTGNVETVKLVVNHYLNALRQSGLTISAKNIFCHLIGNQNHTLITGNIFLRQIASCKERKRIGVKIVFVNSCQTDVCRFPRLLNRTAAHGLF